MKVITICRSISFGCSRKSRIGYRRWSLIFTFTSGKFRGSGKPGVGDRWRSSTRLTIANLFALFVSQFGKSLIDNRWRSEIAISSTTVGLSFHEQQETLSEGRSWCPHCDPWQTYITLYIRSIPQHCGSGIDNFGLSEFFLFRFRLGLLFDGYLRC